MKSKLYYIYLGFLLLVAFFLSAGAASAQDDIDPQRMTIMQYAINERPLLAELLTTAGLAPALSGSSPHTLLMPPEESLQSLKGQPVETIRAVMAMHIVKGKYKVEDFKEGNRVPVFSGESLYVCRKRSDTLLNGVKLAAVDQEMRNGLIQEVSGLLHP